MSPVVVHFTEQEANSLMQVLATAPMPYTVSQPLIQRLGQAMQVYQQMQQQQMQEPPEAQQAGQAIANGAMLSMPSTQSRDEYVQKLRQQGLRTTSPLPLRDDDEPEHKG